MKDIERHNSNLADLIQNHYYRLYPYLCLAVKNFMKDQVSVCGVCKFHSPPLSLKKKTQFLIIDDRQAVMKDLNRKTSIYL